MPALRITANTNPKSSSRSQKRERILDTRRADLKTVRNQLKNISTDERKRLQDMWKMHKNFFSDDETLDVVVMPEQSINEYFEN